MTKNKQGLESDVMTIRKILEEVETYGYTQGCDGISALEAEAEIKKAVEMSISECKHENQPDTDGHPYCRKCGKYAYSDTYKPIKMPTISIDKEVAKKWADEMLAQAKYARLSPQSVVDLLNEIRKGL